MIEWNTNNIGNIHKYNLVIPASSIKGALSHRIAYHYNLLQQKWADTGDAKAGEENEAVKALFGYCKNNNQSDGARGKVIINDIFIPDEEFNQKLINHVSIDRFTGGAMPGKLFNERPVCADSRIPLTILVEKEVINEPDPQNPNLIRKALKHTLIDLAEGRLQLGAGSGRGNGYFRAEIPGNFL